MLDELKKKIAHTIIKAKYVKKTEKPIIFNKIITNSRSFLVILPSDENDFFNSIDILKYLVIHKKEVTVFIPEHRYSVLPEKEKFRTISFHIKQVNWLNLPNNNLIKRMKANFFDIVIDLNRDENIFSSAIANLTPSLLRVGINRTNFENYYNLVFERPEIEPERAYFKLLVYLKMF